MHGVDEVVNEQMATLRERRQIAATVIQAHVRSYLVRIELSQSCRREFEAFCREIGDDDALDRLTWPLGAVPCFPTFLSSQQTVDSESCASGTSPPPSPKTEGSSRGRREAGVETASNGGTDDTDADHIAASPNEIEAKHAALESVVPLEKGEIHEEWHAVAAPSDVENSVPAVVLEAPSKSTERDDSVSESVVRPAAGEDISAAVSDAESETHASLQLTSEDELESGAVSEHEHARVNEVGADQESVASYSVSADSPHVSAHSEDDEHRLRSHFDRAKEDGTDDETDAHLLERMDTPVVVGEEDDVLEEAKNVLAELDDIDLSQSMESLTNGRRQREVDEDDEQQCSREAPKSPEDDGEPVTTVPDNSCTAEEEGDSLRHRRNAVAEELEHVRALLRDRVRYLETQEAADDGDA